MSDEIQVHVINRGRKTLYYRWSDPVAGTGGECSSGCRTRRDATKGIPAFIEQKKAERPAVETEDTSWKTFCSRFEREYLATRRQRTTDAWNTAKKRFEGIVQPTLLKDADYSAISQFMAELREQGLRPASIDAYLRSLRAALKEAARLFPEYIAPHIKTGSHDPGGRPLGDEEVQAMLDATEGVVGKAMAIEYRRLIRAVPWCGLRRIQIFELSWNEDSPIYVRDIDGDQPMIVVTKEGHKGKREQWLPCIPAMTSILREIPAERRYGRVFQLDGDAGWVGKQVARIGQAAGIETGTRMMRFRKDQTFEGKRYKAGEAVEVTRYASLHDLKRTYATRLMQLGMFNAEVAELCQHSDFATTAASYLPKAEMLGNRLSEVFSRQQKKKIRLHDPRRDAG